MDNLWIQESFVDETDHCRLGEGNAYETRYDNLGELYRSLRKEYDKASKMYVDRDNKPQQVGWVFTKRTKYEDCDEYYIRSVWVTVMTKEPIKHVTWEREYPKF